MKTISVNHPGFWCTVACLRCHSERHGSNVVGSREKVFIFLLCVGAIMWSRTYDWLEKVCRTAKDDFWRFIDLWNLVGIIIILSLIGWSLYQGWDVRWILAVLTAATVFTSFNQMRQSMGGGAIGEKSPVRREIQIDDERGYQVPVLSNFGSNPAHDFYLLSAVEGVSDTPQEIDRIKVEEEPLNLESGKSVSLMTDELETILKKNDFDDASEASLNLYYCYSTIQGVSVPGNVSNPDEWGLSKFRRNFPDPVSFKLSTLQSRMEKGSEERLEET